LRSEASKYCEKLERDIIEVESLVQKNKELEDANKDMHEKNSELHRQLSELQERLVTKDKVCFYVENRFLR
jgi:predicted RNase H-like nuclease (RuvC/YqgF family)